MNFNYKNITVNYTDTGTGTAVILLHGFLEDMTIWKETAGVLSKNNRVIAVDLLGHGKTGNIGYVHTMEDQAEMVHALLSHLHLREYILIGHSMGGYVSLAFANKYTDRVKGLCLLNSTPFSDTEEKKQNRDRAIAIVKKDKSRFLTESIPNLFADENRAQLAEEIKDIIDIANNMSKQGIINALEGMKIRKDLSSFFKSATFEKTIIMGGKDPIMDVEKLNRYFADTMVNPITLQGGHMSYLEDVENCINALKDFIKTCN